MENENNNLEKEELEKAAEKLRNINFNQENYKELLEVINKIKILSQNKKEIMVDKTGVAYMTDNGNMFIASENISEEKYKQLATETDIDFFKERLEKLTYTESDDWKYKQFILDQRYDIQKKIDELTLKLPHEEEIERSEPIEGITTIAKESDKEIRDNTSYNFRHNFGVYCRREASSPIDSVRIAKEITSRMDKEEQQKTYRLLKQMAREDETITQVLVRSYLEAVRESPLNEEYIKNNYSDKLIARPFYDTISEKGHLVDKNSTLRVGDTIQNLAFNVDKVFGTGKDKIYEDLTVISSSKEGNKIILMDKDKSFYEVPRDTLLQGYNKQQEKQYKAEIKHQH